jgi:peptidyl-prolyl cis-trans isomerase C
MLGSYRERKTTMVQMMRWIGVLALVLAAGCGKKEEQVVTPNPSMATEVAVWVDQVGITSGQIQKEASRLFLNVPKDVPPEQIPMIQMRVLQQAVDNLVVRQLVKGEMERSGVLISQDEVEKGKQDLQKGLGEGHSLAMLVAEANLPIEELEANLRLDLFKNKVLKDQLQAAIEAVTEAAVKTYYDENPKEFTEPEGRLASHILVRVPADADEAAKTDARAKAEGIRKALLEGADFEKLAGEVSDCASRSRGGALGVIPKGREAKSFEDAVYSQKIGELGEVVESPVGFHVIKATGEQAMKVVPFDKVKDRLSLVLKSQASQKVTADYITELKSKATIKLDGTLAQAVAEAEKAAKEAKASGESAVTAPAAEGAAPAAEAPASAAAP